MDPEEGQSSKRKQQNSLPEGLFGAFEGHLRSLGVWIRVSKAEGTRRQDWWGMEDKVT